MRIWIDNSTTVAYLKKEGGTRSQALLRLSHPHPEVGLRPANSHVSAAYRMPPECVSGLSVEDRTSDSVGVGG